MKDTLGKEMPKPVEYWRDMLDAEIMTAIWNGSRYTGKYELSVLAKERLNELMCCGHSGLYGLVPDNKKEGE